MNFLIYIEHAAENLQFFLWYRNYTKRFSELPASERALAPEWTMDAAEAEAFASQTNAAPKTMTPEVAQILKGTDFGPKPTVTVSEYNGNPFNTPPRTPIGERDSVVPSENGWSDDGSTLKSSDQKSFIKKTATAFEGANIPQPCKFSTILAFVSVNVDALSHHSAVP